MDLRYEGGAAGARIDLSGIPLTSLALSSGASATDVVLPPPRGTLHVTVQSGAASMKLRLPPMVPAASMRQSIWALPALIHRVIQIAVMASTSQRITRTRQTGLK